VAELGLSKPDKIPKCCLGDPAMADEHYIVMTVECQHCKTKQKVHIAASTDGAQMGSQTMIGSGVTVTSLPLHASTAPTISR